MHEYNIIETKTSMRSLYNSDLINPNEIGMQAALDFLVSSNRLEHHEKRVYMVLFHMWIIDAKESHAYLGQPMLFKIFGVTTNFALLTYFEPFIEFNMLEVKNRGGEFGYEIKYWNSWKIDESYVIDTPIEF